MIFFSKLFTVTVLPPGCIIAALIVAIIVIPRRFKLIMIVVTVLLYGLSIQPVSDALLRPIEDAYPPLVIQPLAIPPLAAAAEAEGSIDAIVILGGGTIIGSPEAGEGRDSLGSDAVKRAVYAFGLRDRFSAPFIFTGGKVFDYNQDPEAVTAGRLLTSLGLPPERLVLESGSRNTWENAKAIAEMGYTRVILVTSAYHMPRSVYCFAKNGITVFPAPTDYKCDRGRKYDLLSFMPVMNSLHNSYLALHEYVGLACYRLMYRK